MADATTQVRVQSWSKILGMIIGLAATVALGVGVLMWTMKPSYTALYSGMEGRDASEVVTALQGAGIPYELDSATGIVKVESGRVHEARLKLAEQGLPRGTGMGVEMLQQEQGFGTSQFIESARYHHAMETELSRTISTMRNVKSARVHLALPKRSVFVRDQDKATASVALTLYGGRTIEQGQVDAIVHLVASSIPHLAPELVTVVDQNGRLLSSGDNNNKVALTAKQYEYTRTVEENYTQRIERLLESIAGPGKVRATVNAEIDFSEEESTEERFNPERAPEQQPVVRSEQLAEKSSMEQAVAGVPGALSNQPPQGGELQPGAGNVAGGVAAPATPQNSSRNTVRNYEIDRTIRHKRLDVGQVKRLSVAVLVDDRVTIEKGKTVRTPLTPEEVTRMTALVQQAIGFDEARGDKVNVINAAFTPVEAEEALPEPSLFDQPWVQNLGKQLLAGIIILVLIFTIIRPTVKNLNSFVPQVASLPGGAGAGAGEGGAAGGAGGQARLEHMEKPLGLPSDHDQKVEFAKAMVDQDARRVANVVKEWVGNEA